MINAVQQILQPEGAFTAGGTLAARFMAEKLHRLQRHPDHVGVLVHHNDRRGTHHRVKRQQAIKGDNGIQCIGLDDGAGAAGGQNRLNFFVAGHALAIRFAKNQLAVGDLAHDHFVVTRPVHMTTQANNFGTRAVLGA